MLYLVWDREINISLFFCDVFVRKLGPRPRTSSRCYHSNKSAATFNKGIFVHSPWVPTCMQNLKGGWKFSFPKMFDFYRLVLNTEKVPFLLLNNLQKKLIYTSRNNFGFQQPICLICCEVYIYKNNVVLIMMTLFYCNVMWIIFG